MVHNIYSNKVIQFVGTLRVDNGTNFWSYFTFTEVLNIAMANKKAFYMIYFFDVHGFKKFFDVYWKNKTLEFFDNSRIENVILPNIVPDNIIGEIKTQKITFQPHYDYPLSRKDVWNKRSDLELTILGSYCYFIANPIIDLLISYNFMQKLILKKVYLTPEIINCIAGCNCTKLTFIDCLVREEDYRTLFFGIANIKKLKILYLYYKF